MGVDCLRKSTFERYQQTLGRVQERVSSLVSRVHREARTTHLASDFMRDLKSSFYDARKISNFLNQQSRKKITLKMNRTY